MKIIILDGYTLKPGDLSWKGFHDLGQCAVYERTNPAQTYERAKDADVLITNKVVLDANLMEQLPKLKYVGVLATGYNVVDVEAAKKRGISVTNIPAYSTDSVAQIVFAFILNFSQQVMLHSQEVKKGMWENWQDFSFTLTPQTELAGKTLGIVGFGKIGQKIAHIANAFNMDVLFYNPSKREGWDNRARQVGLEELFVGSDYVSINCPLTNDNLGFVNTKLLQLMKPTAYLINTGRGPLVNEQDLADFLNQGKIAGAGLDVLSTEPPKPNNPLLKAKNCYITPHIAWATFEARQRAMEIATNNLKSFIDCKPQNLVG